MSTLKVLAVRDRAVEAFGTPIFCNAIGQGVRSFIDEVNRDGGPMNAHPEDYELYLVGEFDDQAGRMIQVDLRQLAAGRDVRRSKE